MNEHYSPPAYTNIFSVEFKYSSINNNKKMKKIIQLDSETVNELSNECVGRLIEFQRINSNFHRITEFQFIAFIRCIPTILEHFYFSLEFNYSGIWRNCMRCLEGWDVEREKTRKFPIQHKYNLPFTYWKI